MKRPEPRRIPVVVALCLSEQPLELVREHPRMYAIAPRPRRCNREAGHAGYHQAIPEPHPLEGA